MSTGKPPEGDDDHNPLVNSPYFIVKSSGAFGRYLVAKEDIPTQTLVLSESPFIFGPVDEKDDEGNVNICCLSCCKQLFSFGDENPETSVDKLYHCSKCGWPVCDKVCETDIVHAEKECKLFNWLGSSDISQKGSTYPPPNSWLMYKSITLLRTLLLIKSGREEAWDNFLAPLEHHSETRGGKPYCVTFDEIVLQNLEHLTKGLEEKLGSVSKKTRKKYSLPYIHDRLFLKRLIGAFNTNAYCGVDVNEKRIARCLFPNGTLFAHSCAPNSYWTVEMPSPGETKSGVIERKLAPPLGKVAPRMLVYTALPIKKGEMITIPYNVANIFLGTLKRQLEMETVGHFICQCARCKSPTELGTFMSAIRCFDCESGFLVSEDPTCQDSDWECLGNDCAYSCCVTRVNYVVSNVQNLIDLLRGSGLAWNVEQEHLERLFTKYHGNELHENHYLLHEISKRLVDLYREHLWTDAVASMGRRERETLRERLIFHVRYMMRIANLVLPGSNSHQGQLHVYLEEAESLKSDFR